MSKVNQQSTTMCVRITEPSFALVGYSLDQVRERVVRQATRMFAEKLFDESPVVVRNIQPFGSVLGSSDITYEVELALVPVAEHKILVQALKDELLRVQMKLRDAERMILKQEAKILNVKKAVEAKL